MKLILASRSPRRCELLARLEIPFEVMEPRFEERPTLLPAGEEALHFAEQKARSVAGLCPDSWVIGADTLIGCEGQKIGKPATDEQARKMIQMLSGKKHQVFTAVILLDTGDGSLKRHLEKVTVTFRKLSEREIDNYVATGEPIAKAGGYAIQGKGRGLIAEVAGDEEAVIGLPLKILREWLV